MRFGMYPDQADDGGTFRMEVMSQLLGCSGLGHIHNKPNGKTLVLLFMWPTK